MYIHTNNQAYGKWIEDPSKYSSTKVIPAENFGRYSRKPTLKSYTVLEMENEDADLVELNLAKRKVEDSLPVHIGNCILMNAKLHFLRYF